MKSRSRSAKPPKSNFEKSFERAQMLKRNKRYVDIPRVTSVEKDHEVLRRMPIKIEGEKSNNKFQQSFMNSTA